MFLFQEFQHYRSYEIKNNHHTKKAKTTAYGGKRVNFNGTRHIGKKSFFFFFINFILRTSSLYTTILIITSPAS